MSQEEPIDETNPGGEQVTETDPAAVVFGEHVVLGGTSEDDADEVVVMQEYADTLLWVLAGAAGLERAEVTERVERALDRIGRDPHSVEIAEITDKVLRGSHSSLTIETNDGVVLGYAEGKGAAYS